MKQLNPFVFDRSAYERELTQYRTFLTSKPNLSENKDILPFFRQNQQLSSQISRFLTPYLSQIDSIAFEYNLFGDFVCDLVLGNKKTDSYCFVEFEDATENSVFFTKKVNINLFMPLDLNKGIAKLLTGFTKSVMQALTICKNVLAVIESIIMVY